MGTKLWCAMLGGFVSACVLLTVQSITAQDNVFKVDKIECKSITLVARHYPCRNNSFST